jgi:hypothetical protein
MLNSLQPPSGFYFLAGNLSVLITAVVVVVLAALGFYAFRRVGPGALAGMLAGSALVLLGALVTTVLPWSDDAALRRSVETRTAELTARAIAPGSALACLDAVANAEIETACERVLFATPEAVAIAVAYIDAKVSLLAASAALAARDPDYQPSFERMRRALEADRFGVVAHVLTTRGCTVASCPDLKHLRNSGPILANLKAQTFDGHVSARANAWHLNDGGAMAALPAAAGAAPAAAMPSAAAAVGAGKKIDFPSAASIPAVSIMAAEPSSPGSAEQAESRAAAAPAKKPQGPSARRPSSRDNAAREAQPAQPMSVLPPPPPSPQNATPPAAASPQTSGQR